jgi:hypothetical protein
VEPASASARKQQHFQLKSGKRVRVPNERMDMPTVVTPSVNVTDMACVGHVVYTIAFPQLCGLTPTFAWLYIHMSVTRWDVTPRNACLWPQALLDAAR